tara:strand:- start:19220 stop:19375 length:156 start_codon:yes stop_codon:yes gene_type:complete
MIKYFGDRLNKPMKKATTIGKLILLAACRDDVMGGKSFSSYTIQGKRLNGA